MADNELERIEIELLLEGLYRAYGYDFRDYAYPSLKRRIWTLVYKFKLHTISELQSMLLHNKHCVTPFIQQLSIPVTEMFRDPSMYRAFRKKVIPTLRTLPSIRIWHAGCASGEEAYSMAILLKEEGLYEKSRIYATDMNVISLQQGKEGRIPLEKMQQYSKNYFAAGGTKSFSEYYTIGQNGTVQLHESLRKHIIFADHNLVTDRSFNEFDVIFCRNVMIYFNETLRERVHQLFMESLSVNGVLVLGAKESIHYIDDSSRYTELDRHDRIYQKIR